MQSGEMQPDNPTLAEKLATAIADGILSGALKPGLRLDEVSLAQQHGVSRTPVREALQRLAASGLVVSRGRQGLQVAQLSIADLLDAFSVAAEMEALAAAQASRRIRPDSKKALKRRIRPARPPRASATPIASTRLISNSMKRSPPPATTASCATNCAG